MNPSIGYLLKTYFIILFSAIKRTRASREDLSSVSFLIFAPLFYALEFKGKIETPFGALLIRNRSALRSFAYGLFKTHFMYLHSLKIISSSHPFYQVVVDVGANMGDFTLAMTSKAGKIVAVEPGERSFEALKANIKMNDLKNVVPLKLAAHEREEKVFLEGSSSDMYITNTRNGESAQGMPLKTIISSLGIKSIDLLKIDVQGHERSVLLGTLELLKKKIVKLLIVEIHLRRNVRIMDILSFLESCGYHLIYEDNHLVAQPHLYFKPSCSQPQPESSSECLNHSEPHEEECMTDKSGLRAFPFRFYFEIGLLFGMLVTLLIPSMPSPITTWGETSALLFVRAFVWLVGLVIVPGAGIFRLVKIGKNLPVIEKSAVETNLSFVFIGLMALVFYSLRIDFALLPWFALSILAILDFIYWFSGMRQLQPTKLEIAKWHRVLLIEILVVVSLALLVQLNQQYLIPGDNWLAAKSAIEILSQRDVYQTFRIIEYPLMFGFMLSGLSAGSGMPVINTYVLLFPLVVLNIITFYALMKIVFSMNDKVATISSVLYGLGGGLGLVIQVLVFNGTKDFWGLSFLSQDMYFFSFFWNNVTFSYKFLAISLAYTSITLFVITIREENKTGRAILLMLSSLSMLFSFLTHMLEPMFFVPLILAVAYVETKGRGRVIHPTLFLLGALVFGFLLDSVMAGLYSSLIVDKTESFMSSINIPMLGIYSSVLSIVIFSLFLTRRLFPSHLEIRSGAGCLLVKYAIVVAIALAYVAGLWFWASSLPSLQVSSTFPWYRYVTRYGLLGGLAIFGLAVIVWKGKWFAIASFWSILAILLGSLWWGERTNAYLFPMIALFAACALDWVWSAGNRTNLRITVETTEASVRGFRLKLKPVAATLIVIVLTLSFSSVIYGSAYYIVGSPPTSDSAVRAFEWIYWNSPENAAVLVPQDYVITRGISTISDRSVYQNTKLTSTIDMSSFTNLTESLYIYNIRYAVTKEGEADSDLMKNLLAWSTLRFQSGKVKIFELPLLKPPSQEYGTAVWDRELLGLQGSKSNYGWVDDEFTSNWTWQNVNASSNGEVLTYRWEFNSGDAREPSMRKSIPAVDTNNYPYIVVRYRNTPETTDTAQNNIGQIITLVNETGYPQGFIKNIYLPISKRSTFSTFVSKLPENQSIASVIIWMRNYKQFNGTADLQIDYVGFASNDPTLEPQFQIHFLTMAIPSLWPTDYTIKTDMSEARNATTIVTSYDKSALNLIQNSSYAGTFVFLNATTDTPLWGTNWQTIEPGILSGSLNGKKIVIIGVSNQEENITNLAEKVYIEISE